MTRARMRHLRTRVKDLRALPLRACKLCACTVGLGMYVRAIGKSYSLFLRPWSQIGKIYRAKGLIAPQPLQPVRSSAPSRCVCDKILPLLIHKYPLASMLQCSPSSLAVAGKQPGSALLDGCSYVGRSYQFTCAG